MANASSAQPARFILFTALPPRSRPAAGYFIYFIRFSRFLQQVPARPLFAASARRFWPLASGIRPEARLRKQNLCAASKKRRNDKSGNSRSRFCRWVGRLDEKKLFVPCSNDCSSFPVIIMI
jgi:hypothetical protein